MKPILPHVPQNDDALCSAAFFFSRFRIGELFRKSARSGKGVPAFKILQFLFALAFLKKGFFEMMREHSLPWGKDVVYRFLSSTRINWRRFLLLTAKRVIDVFFLPLTGQRGDRVLILDDSDYSRNRSKQVELLSKCYDHCSHSYFKGFRMLTLGWSDGRSFLPLLFTLLGSTKEENRLCGVRDSDGRTSGARRKKEALMKRPEAAMALLDGALKNGIKGDYLLFDSWFATNQFLHMVRRRNIHAVCMLKDFNSMQFLAEQADGTTKRMKLASLYNNAKSGFEKKSTLGSVLVQVDGGKNSSETPLAAKVVFVQNRKAGAKREWLALLSTDISIPDEEVVRIYGKRWSIEVFFKACKSTLRLAKEFQTRSYSSLVAHTSIVFLRYMMLSFETRSSEDDRTYGELFYRCCEEMEDVSFGVALELLLQLLKEVVEKGIALSGAILEELFKAFLEKTPNYLREKMGVSVAFSLS